ncbi:hypothetical protein GGF50DRAFT_103536 [Schizophyllum commune]
MCWGPRPNAPGAGMPTLAADFLLLDTSQSRLPTHPSATLRAQSPCQRIVAARTWRARHLRPWQLMGVRKRAPSACRPLSRWVKPTSVPLQLENRWRESSRIGGHAQTSGGGGETGAPVPQNQNVPATSAMRSPNQSLRATSIHGQEQLN